MIEDWRFQQKAYFVPKRGKRDATRAEIEIRTKQFLSAGGQVIQLDPGDAYGSETILYSSFTTPSDTIDSLPGAKRNKLK